MTAQHAAHVEQVDIDILVPYARNARTHSEEQIGQIAASLTEFGFTNPVLIDQDHGIIAGHGRVLAAKRLGLASVPCIRLGWLTDLQKRAYILADNKIAENSGWDQAMLEAEMDILKDAGIDLECLGFVEEGAPPPEVTDTPKSETSEVNDVFWISIVGPLKNQAQALDRLQSVMADLEPVTVELGTVSRG